MARTLASRCTARSPIEVDGFVADRLDDPWPTCTVELGESEPRDVFTWVLLLEASSRDALAGDHSNGVPSVLAWLVRRCAAHPPGSRHGRAALATDGSLPRSSCALEVMMRLPDDMCDPAEPRRPPRGIRTAIVARLLLSSGRPVGARSKASSVSRETGCGCAIATRTDHRRVRHSDRSAGHLASAIDSRKQIEPGTAATAIHSTYTTACAYLHPREYRNRSPFGVDHLRRHPQRQGRGGRNHG